MTADSGAAASAHPFVRAVWRVLPAPFGWHTRHMLASYGRFAFLATFALLVLALSIDSTLFLVKVLAVVAIWPGPRALWVAWYLILRATDFLTELLPLGCFIGVFFAEIVHTRSRERLIVWLSGRAAPQCVTPIVLFALIVGLLQLGLNIYLRPLAVMTLAADRLGSYGENFNPAGSGDPQWIAAGHDLIEAIVEPGATPVLRDVRVYRLDRSFDLKGFWRARSAKPAGEYAWMLFDGYEWVSETGDAGADAERGGLFDSGHRVAFTQRELDLQAAPIWVANSRIGARYLPNSVFRALGKVEFAPDSEYRTWAQARYSLALFCAAMPLLATGLAMMLMTNSISVPALFFIVLSGYAANLAMKVTILLGEHGRLAPVLAGWTVPLLLLACAAAVTGHRQVVSAQARLRRRK